VRFTTQCLVALTSLFIPALLSAEERISLQDAVNQASATNEEFRVLELRIERAQAIKREAFAGFLPQVGVGLIGTINGQEIVLQDRVITPRFDWGGNAYASIMLFDGRLYPLYSEAGIQVNATEALASWGQHILRFQVEQAFFELAAAERQLEIAKATIELRKAYADRARALAEQGIAIPLDAARAESQVLVAEQALLAAQARLGNQADVLAVLLGRESGEQLRATLREGDRTTPPASKEVVGKRSDLEADQLFIQALEKREQAIWWGLLPSLELRTIGRVGPSSLSNPDNFLWAVSLNLSWLLYDGGARFARARAVSAETQIAELQLTASQRQINADQARALRDWKASFRAIEVASRNVEVSQNAYEMANARFDAGLATSIEVTEASDELFRAQLSLVQSELEADLASSRFRFAQGNQR